MRGYGFPMGNWQDRVDELEEENRDLMEHNSRIEDEVADLLFQLDEMRDVVAKTVEARKEAERLTDHYREMWADELSRRIDVESDARRLAVSAQAGAEQLQEKVSSLELERNHDVMDLRVRLVAANERADKAEARADVLKGQLLSAEADLAATLDRTDKAETLARRAALDYLTVDNESAENYKRAQEAEARAASHWESAKYFCRAFLSWRKICIDTNRELRELKDALLVLGGKER